jgi:serine/threonine-protein kinase
LRYGILGEFMVDRVRPRSLAGRYDVREKIAAGGMATVYFGQLRGPGGFTKDVAIKQLHAEAAGEDGFASMLLDEARLAARIHHPNVVATLEVLREGDELFVVMDYIHGETLSRLVQRARSGSSQVPPPIVVAIMAGALRGLHAAHEATTEDDQPLGVVHRDVSPQNIVVGADGVARILDFGIAKAVGRLQTTSDGQLKGKVAYMAPEQIRGQEVDRRTDIFAAGIVTWEALTSARLFAGDSPAESMSKIIAGDVMHPSVVVPALPSALGDVVLRALALVPSDRFSTALELAEALEAAVPGATPREVAEWLKGLMGEDLARRRRELRAAASAQEETRPEVIAVVDAAFGGESTAAKSFAGTPPRLSLVRPPWPRVTLVLGAGVSVAAFLFWNLRTPAHETLAAPAAAVPSSLVTAPDPPPVVIPPTSMPSAVAESPSPVAPAPRPERAPGEAAPRPARRRDSPVAVAAARPAPSASAPSAASRHCHYEKVLADGGITLPKLTCE